MPEQTVSDLDKALPGFGRIVKLAEDAAPIIHRLAPHYQAAKPDLAQLIALAEKSWPEIEAVLPTIDELIVFAKGTQSEFH